VGRHRPAGDPRRAGRPLHLQHHEQPGAQRQPQHRHPRLRLRQPGRQVRRRREDGPGRRHRRRRPHGGLVRRQQPALRPARRRAGVEFSDAYGLTQADYATRTPHAWQAGPRPACWPASSRRCRTALS
jgi:hypothetical protein